LIRNIFKGLFSKGLILEGKELSGFLDRIGHNFKNPDLLTTALTHRSYSYSKEQDALNSNERLEFLGDAVLDLVVTQYLYETFEDKREGTLSQHKSLIISSKVLKESADIIELGRYIFLSRSEEKSGGRERSSILADAFEALIAAIYLDGGYEAAGAFIRKFVLGHLDAILGDDNFHNYKSELLEYAQGRGIQVPKYSIAVEEGPDHDKTFTIIATLGEREIGRGLGKSKKDAEQLAARVAVEKLRKEEGKKTLNE